MKAFVRSFDRQFRAALAGLLLIMMIACEDFVEVDPPETEIVRETVFENGITATSAITGIYSDMYTKEQAFASGNRFSVTALCGLSSDELRYLPTSIDFQTFESNSLSAENINIWNLWQSLYYCIYGANSALEGLQNSKYLEPETKNQLIGEAIFIRSFCYFYLVNLFGDVPFLNTTEFEKNSTRGRDSKEFIYRQITDDLINAKSLLGDSYPTEGRVRPNKGCATAMLARVYLYLQDWPKSESQATELIENPNYHLEPDLDDVFLRSSKEAIWQLMPVGNTLNTNEGFTFILNGAPNESHPFFLSQDLLNSFETGDKRFQNWVKGIPTGSTTFFFPYKYKVAFGGVSSIPPTGLSEFSMVLRLAEQYLIRAEARTHQGKYFESANDINEIRHRAGVLNIETTCTGLTKECLLIAIENERRNELFSEWGHRWLDLNRTSRSDIILVAKSFWTPNDKLYPIPQPERNKNPYLGEQNPGY